MRGARGVLAAAVLGAAITGVAAADTTDIFTTQLLSAGADGRGGNGPSAHPVISQDRRTATVVAFDSLATDLVPGDVNGQADVFVRDRAPGFGADGDPWVPGGLRLISRGMGGAPANGPSTLPALSGDSRTPARCIAFVSAASNLVPGDTNGKPDAYVADLATGAITRVSVGSGRRQSNGSTFEVVVDGRCRRVAFIADATNLATAKGSTPTSRAMRTGAPEPAGSRQVYVRGIGGTSALDKDMLGVTWVVSRARDGRPSAGAAAHVAMTPNGQVVGFDTTGSDLVAGDANGATDVFEAVMTRRRLAKVHHRRPQALSIALRLVSASGAGTPGAGPSSSPALNNDGSRVAFVTAAPNIVAGATPQTTQIAWTDLTRRPAAATLVSHVPGSGAPGNGPSANPSITAAGTWVAYDTAASNLPASATFGGPAQPRNVLVWMQGTDSQTLASDDSAETPLPGISATPRASAHGNYIVFVNGSPAQVMLRYFGPR